jgi:hypothetical protein
MGWVSACSFDAILMMVVAVMIVVIDAACPDSAMPPIGLIVRRSCKALIASAEAYD